MSKTDFKIGIIPEPRLTFANNQSSEHPKDGLFLYGPTGFASKRGTLNFGVIGTQTGLQLFSSWAKSVQKYIPPHKENVAHHSPFPGFETIFGLQWPEAPIASIEVSATKISKQIRITNRYEAIKSTVDIFSDAILKHLRQDADITPDFWYVVVPDEIYQWGRPQKAPPMSERSPGKARMRSAVARNMLQAPSLFEEDNWQADLQRYDLNFHNQLKARLINNAVVQIVREQTLAEAADISLESNKRKIQDPATVAWNLCTTSYYKCSGPPWRLEDIRPGVCYVGIVFKKDASSLDKGNACCGAQLFLRSGEGLVFKGAVGPWYSSELKQFHLPKEKAQELMSLAIAAYKDVHDVPPKEVFIHGRSRFNAQEWEGFQAAAGDATNIVAIRIRPTDELKLFRLATQPPIRGTYLQTTPRMAYLWTKGYVARFGTYPGFETPNPIAVNIDWGDADLTTVLTDIMALTKVNFNGCTFGDGVPVTLKFADAIGEILTAAPDLDSAPQPFKYYI